MKPGWTERSLSWLVGKPSAPLIRQVQRLECLPDLWAIRVMADAHEGATVPNGVVTATTSHWYPHLVGVDMGCGVSALAFSGDWGLTPSQGERALALLQQAVPTLKHTDLRKVPALPEGCVPQDLRHPRLAKVAEREGRWELGTLGRGNHFLELAQDRQGRLWALVHTGSRALGPKLLEAYSAPAQAGFEADSETGRAWLNDAEWVVRYASWNREVILNRLIDVVEGMGGPRPQEDSYIDSPHNFPRQETHGGQVLYVHRKSANSAAAGEVAIIPGSMAVGSRLVRGLGNEASLSSSSHGAGRALGRKEAFATLTVKDLEGLMGSIVYRRGLASQLMDEAPKAYKNLDQVMAHQSDLVRTVEVLVPILNDKRV